MIDLHTHILPGVDDGSRNMETSLQMLDTAIRDGIEQIALTPHVLTAVEPGWRQAAVNAYNTLREEVEKREWPVKLHLGGEIYLQANLMEYRETPFFALGDAGKYVLLELPSIEIPQFTEKVVFDLAMQGMKAVIAHPERNASIIGRSSRIVDLVERGAYTQVNAGSLLGRFGSDSRDFALRLLKQNLITIVASDAHDPGSRRPVLSEAFALVADTVGEERAVRLFKENPSAILAGKEIPRAEYIEEIEEPGLFKKIFKNLFR